VKYDRGCTPEKRANCERNYPKEVIQKICEQCKSMHNEPVNPIVFNYLEINAIIEAGAHISANTLEYKDWLSLANFKRALERYRTAKVRQDGNN